MNFTIESIQQTFFRQSETCLKTSLLYHDMLKIFGSNDNVLNFSREIINKRNITGIIEAVLTFLAFFHYNTLKNNPDFTDLKNLYKTQGGNYQPEDITKLENVLNKLLKKYLPDSSKNDFKKNQLFKWMMETKLQTNEIARCNIVYPAVLSLGLEKINLIELGCSSGLMLLMDLFSYEYSDGNNVFRTGENKPVLFCKTDSLEKVEKSFLNKTEIVRRIGLDLFPVDLNDTENVLRLRSTLWDDTERSSRLAEAIELFHNTNNKPVLLALDYTEDLSLPLKQLLEKDSELVFYTSVSTYQIPDGAYNNLFESLNELSLKMNKPVYFIEFEERRKGQEKDVTVADPFHLTIHTFPEKNSQQFGRAHFHGKSVFIA